MTEKVGQIGKVQNEVCRKMKKNMLSLFFNSTKLLTNKGLEADGEDYLTEVFI